MNIQIVKNLGLIALLGSLSLPVFAQPGPGGGPGSGQGSGQGYGQGYGPGAGWSLMSPAERDAHRSALWASKSLEDCRAVQAKHRALVEARAQERGIALPPEPPNVCERVMAGGAAGPGMMGGRQGMGPGGGVGPGGGMGRGPGRGQGYGPGAGLLTPEEMSAHRNAMRAAGNLEACRQVQGEHRALIERRAQEKGVSVPPMRADVCARRFEAGAQPGNGRPRGAGAGAAPGRALLTPEERAAHLEQMRAVRSYDECKALQAEHRTQMEARAKAQGVNLPPPRAAYCERFKAGTTQP